MSVDQPRRQPLTLTLSERERGQDIAPPVVARHADGRWLKWGFVGPTLLFLIALNVFPLFYDLVLSFTNATLLSPTSHFVGGRNYARVFSDAVFAQAIRTTGVFVFFAVV